MARLRTFFIKYYFFNSIIQCLHTDIILLRTSCVCLIDGSRNIHLLQNLQNAAPSISNKDSNVFCSVYSLDHETYKRYSSFDNSTKQKQIPYGCSPLSVFVLFTSFLCLLFLLNLLVISTMEVSVSCRSSSNVTKSYVIFLNKNTSFCDASWVYYHMWRTTSKAGRKYAWFILWIIAFDIFNYIIIARYTSHEADAIKHPRKKRFSFINLT